MIGMELLGNILENSQYSFITAVILGLMTAISPCPLATNITAIGFISRNIESRRHVFLSGLVYTLGRVVSYTALALLIYAGADKINISRFFQGWGEKLIAPLMIIIGLFMLDIIRIRFPGLAALTSKFEDEDKKGLWRALLLGMIFALAFCPYSGVLYFAILMPLSVSSSNGLFLPVIFAVTTGLPVIIFAWLLAYSVDHVGRLFDRVKLFEKWFRRIVAVIFIGTGIYYLVINFLK